MRQVREYAGHQPSEEEFYTHAAGIESVLYIRCMCHRAEPQINSNENGYGECGACIAESLSEQVVRLREALTNVLGKFPYAEMLDAVDDDEYSGRRYVSLEKVTIGDVRRWRAALSEGKK